MVKTSHQCRGDRRQWWLHVRGTRHGVAIPQFGEVPEASGFTLSSHIYYWCFVELLVDHLCQLHGRLVMWSSRSGSCEISALVLPAISTTRPQPCARLIVCALR